MLPCFKIEGNLPLLTVSLTNSQVYAEKISALSLRTFAGISVFCTAFCGFKCLFNFFVYISSTNFRKIKLIVVVRMASILGWFLYLSIALNIG